MEERPSSYQRAKRLAPTPGSPPPPKWDQGILIPVGVLAVCAGVFVIGAVVGEASDQTFIPSPSAPAESPPPPPTLLSPEESARLIKADLLAAALPCDEAVEKVGAARFSKDRYELFELGAAARDACRDSALAIGRVRAPERSSDAIAKTLNDRIGDCSLAYQLQSMAYGFYAKSVDNNDTRPSTVADFRGRKERAEAAVVACAVSMADIALLAGDQSKEP